MFRPALSIETPTGATTQGERCAAHSDRALAAFRDAGPSAQAMLLSVLLVLFAAGCASHKAGGRAVPSQARPAPDYIDILKAEGADTPTLRRLMAQAWSWRGAPYEFGGDDKDGVDCSGFTQNVFRSVGVALPRHSGDQGDMGVSVQGRKIRPGDLLFFGDAKGRINHVGLYVGRDYMIHASSSAGGVAVSDLDKEWWFDHFIYAKRVIGVQPAPSTASAVIVRQTPRSAEPVLSGSSRVGSTTIKPTRSVETREARAEPQRRPPTAHSF